MHARRWGAVFGAAVVTVLLAPLAAYATTVVSEGFETSPGTFSLYGANATRDCAVAHSGFCSLKIDPTTTSTRIGAKYTSSTSMGSRTTIAFWFQASSTTGDLDGDFTVRLGPSFDATVHVTEGVGSNTGVSLVTTTGSDRSFDAWTTANTWYQFTMTFDTAADTVVATGPNATSATLSIPSSATTITEIDVNGVEWNPTSNTMRYDDITVDVCTYNLLGICI